MSCKIFRDDKGEITKVIAPNGEESKLYNDLLKVPDVDSDKNLAGEMYLIAYTPSFKSYFGDFENGEIKGLVDVNNEPYASSVVNFLTAESDIEIGKPTESVVTPIEELSDIAKLNERLANGFLKDFNITATEYENLKEELGLDAVSAADLVTKSIAYNQGESITPEVAYFAYSMLGKQNNKVRSELRYLVNKWEKYKERFDYHSKLLRDKEGFNPNKEEWKRKIRDLVILDFLQEKIQQHYLNPQSFTKSLDSKWTSEDFSLWSKIMSFLENLLSSYSAKYKNQKEKLNNLGISIADEVLNNNYEYFNYNLKEDQIQKYYNQTINSDPFAKELVEFGQNIGMVLTGSLALRKAGEVYRTADETLHDIDWVVPYELSNTEENQKTLDNIRKYQGTDRSASAAMAMSYITDLSWFKAFKEKYPSYTVINGFYGAEHNVYESLTVQSVINGEFYKESGFHEEEKSFYRKDPVTKQPVKVKQIQKVKHQKGDWIKDTGYVIDFFARLEPFQEQHENYFKLWKEIMIAKLKMGRDKDFTDWKAFVPYLKSKDSFNFNYEGFRHINYENSQSGAFEETKTSNNKPKFQKETPTVVPTIEMRSVAKVLDKLKEKFGVDYEIVNEPNADWKGKYENGKVYINSAKNITADTPFHEYLHPFVAALKRDNTSLYNKLIAELQSLQEGLDEIESIKTSEGYSKLSEEEMLDEALVSYLGKLSSKSLSDTGDLVTSKTERVRKSMLSQFTNWLRRTFNKVFGIKIKDLQLNYNLQDIADMVSMSDTKINLGELPIEQNANYQLDEKTRGFKQRMKELGNDIQNKVIDDLLHEAKPGEEDLGKVILEEDNHIYMHTKTGQVYKSTTTAIKGELKDPDGMFELNRLFGKHFDQTLQDIIEGKTFDQAKGNMTDVVSEEISRRAYDALQGYIIGVTADGSIVLPQVILADPLSGIAGSLDIFIVKPNGDIFISDLKVSKNSYKSDNYRNRAYDVGKEAVLKGPLTTQQQHGIQVAVYKRLAEVNGYPVKGISTLHILLDVEGSGKDQKVNQFVWEGIQVHQPSANVSSVDQIVPTKGNRNKIKTFKKLLGEHNPADAEDFLTDEEALPEEDIPGDLLDKLQGTIQKFVTKLRQRELYLKNLTKSARFEAFNAESKEQSIDKISELLSAIETKDLGRPDIHFGRLLNYTKDSLTTMFKYITDPSKVDNEGYIDVVLEAEKFVESYDGLASIPELGLGSQEQHKLMRDVQSLLNAVKKEINPALESYVKNLINKKSNQLITEEEIDAILKEGYDISLDQYALGDLQNSKEKLLAIAANLYTEADQKAKNRSDVFIERVKTLGNKLAKALGTDKIDFSFMLNYDAEGNFSGRYLQTIGQQYYDLKRKVYALIKDENGDDLKYIPIANLEDASAEDILHNIDLQRKKEKITEFREAERLDESNQITSGEYHRLSSEFINERAKYETPNPFALRKGFLSWVKKPTVSDEDYRKFKNKYYDRVEYTGVVFERDGSYKGKTEEKIAWFPKTKYVEVKELASSGKDMRDPRYVKLTNPQNDIERAQLEFYNFFDTEMRASLEKLTITEQQKMLGKVARVKDNYLNAAKRKGTSYFKAVTRGTRDWFKTAPQMHSMQRLTDDDGVPVDNLPILYTGDAKNDKKIESIKEKIKELKDQYIINKSITTDEYEKSLKKLELSLAIENGKIEFNDINVDLVQNLIAFRMMAEKFEQMSDIESSLLSIAKIVEKKKYYVADSLGQKFIKKGTEGEAVVKGEGDSLANKRLKKWFKMVYYNNDEYDYSAAATVANKIQNVTSLKGLGFNIFGGINNYVMGRINNAIEAYGGIYYDRAAYFRATGSYNKEYMPGLLKGMGSKDGVYKIDKPNSKYEAMVNYFRMVRKNQDDAGRVSALEIVYIFQEGGEYNVQSKTGMAIAMSSKFELTHNKTGEKLAIYDAFNFDENTGKLSLKPGYEIDEAFKTKVTNYIYEVNKQIHGNYAWEDRMVIQSHWLGQLGAQFHKWVYPGIRSRFQKRYNNENLGDIEGRYRTFFNVMKHVYQTEQGFLAKTAGMLGVLVPGSKAYKQMSDMEVRNMYKNIAELGFFMASFLMKHLFTLLLAGVPPEDEQVKRLLNFMIYQQSRQEQEIKTYIPVIGIVEQYQMVKNPIAGLGTLRDYGEMMASILSLPFPPYDKNYYERGIHKGGLKAWKETRDVIPALGILNRWESFDNVRNFYIR